MASKVQITISIEGAGAKAIDLARVVLREFSDLRDGQSPALGKAAARELAHAVLEAGERGAREARERAEREQRTFGYSFEQTIVTCKTCGKCQRDEPEGEAQEDCVHDYEYPEDVVES